ncbi:unnamed protein product [Paramecium sonneborni]|uniref:Uncharacterized protein n=1 Tax=Paramecium sonneborni TaxID=65129 RepID=A0A8S1RBS9_9CILI|nr:unnamed protein product [Paramecium sonneborni]
MELEKIQLYHKQLQFSNTYNHDNFQVSEGEKVVTEWLALLFCDYAISKTGKIQFAMKKLCGSHFHVQIGFIKIFQKNNYKCYYNGHGTYLIFLWLYFFSSQLKSIRQKLSFEFTNNDIIQQQWKYVLNINTLKWSKQNCPQLRFIMNIYTKYELYPCVGVLRNSKIKILNNIPV